MKSSLITLLASVLCAPLATSPSPFNSIEISESGQQHYLLKWTINPFINENLNIWIPKPDSSSTGNQKTYPVVLFFPGLGANIPSTLYSDVLSQISYKDQGAVVVAWDAFINPTHRHESLVRADKVYAFCQDGGLQGAIDYLFSRPVKVDVNRFFWAGHSSGSQLVALMALANPGADGISILNLIQSFLILLMPILSILLCPSWTHVSLLLKPRSSSLRPVSVDSPALILVIPFRHVAQLDLVAKDTTMHSMGGSIFLMPPIMAMPTFSTVLFRGLLTMAYSARV